MQRTDRLAWVVSATGRTDGRRVLSCRRRDRMEFRRASKLRLANELRQTVGSIDLQRHAGRSRFQLRRETVPLFVLDDGRIQLSNEVIEVRSRHQRSGTRRKSKRTERVKFGEKRRVARPLFAGLQHRAANIHRHSIRHQRRRSGNGAVVRGQIRSCSRSSRSRSEKRTATSVNTRMSWYQGIKLEVDQS